MVTVTEMDILSLTARKKAADNKDEKSKNKDAKQGREITCYKCQKKGHMAKECPDQRGQGRMSPKQQL